MSRLSLILLASMWISFPMMTIGDAIASGTSSKSFLEEFPNLKKDLFTEPKSPFFFGVGLSPLVLLPNRVEQAISSLQLHLQYKSIQIEIINISLGISSISSQSDNGSRHLLLRSSPKITVFKGVSIGPMVGYEFVSFPDIKVILRQPEGSLQTPEQSFSSQGFVYGLALSETFPSDSGYVLQLTQILFKETYPTDKASNGWPFLYPNPTLQSDPKHSAIAPGTGFLLEVSVLF